MLRSLRARLTLTLLFVLMTTVALISLLSNLLINREFETYISKQEQRRSESIVADLETQYNLTSRSWEKSFLHTVGMYSLYDGYIIKIYDKSGILQWDAENHDVSLCSQVMAEISDRMSEAKREGQFITHQYPIKKLGQPVGSVSITYYGPFFFTENDYEFLKTLNGVLFFVGVISSAFAVVIGSILARRISRPITKTAYIAKQIAKGNYDIKFESQSSTAELAEMMTAINHLTDALSEHEALRRRLTTNVAHELRTPLTAVSSHLEAMIEGVWEPTPERLQSCYEEIERLTGLISDLEKLSKYESDALVLNWAVEDIYEIAQTAVQNFESEARGKSIELSLDGEPLSVNVDRARMLQVLMNLLANALNYTPSGGRIALSIRELEEELQIEICDSGIGISEKDIPLIFERFYRTDQSRSRKTGGTGVGLSIAKSIAEAHGGRIEVRSQMGKGSCFSVYLKKNHE